MKKSDKKRYRSLRAYISYIKTFKYQFILVFCTFVVANVLLAVLPIFIGQLTGALAAESVDHGLVYWLVGILITLSVSHMIAWHSAEFLYRALLNHREYEFENVLFRAIMTKPYPYFVGKFTGKISSYVTGLGREFRGFLDTTCYQYADLLVRLPIIGAIMFSVNLYTGLIFTGSIILMFVAGRHLARYVAKGEQDLTDSVSSLDGYVIDVISNFVSVKAFGREQTEIAEVLKRRAGVVAKAKHRFFWAIMFWSSMSLVVRCVVWPATIVMNVTLFLNGQLDLTQITTFLSALVIFSGYIWVVIWNVSQFNMKLARMEESYRYLFDDHDVVNDATLNIRDNRVAKSRLMFKKSLHLRDLEFAYPDRPESPVLQAISLNIAKNEKVGIVGASGSGKTTLIKLLLGYYELPEGTVALDGKVLDSRRLVDLISYVPQDTALFHRTVSENIAYGATGETTQADIERAARRARAHEFILNIDMKYDALVGERGIKLSMGQRQRIAIARAFLSNKPILMLDEATSALDSESEVLVQQSLEDLWRNKTVIAIAHRLSTLRHMDRIIVMDAGRIIEQGTHAGLLAQKGRYYRLWQHQSDGILAE
ncbi:MAG: ABC transporter ATP-binding protein [Candidatus Saccharibacteria bacterium]|nr:MAG: ABC transporter ATP-binding protein [Candidatus Saccharibacteria bacterium]